MHRDVKPANLLLCRAADEVGIVKVLDFGIVQGAREATPTRGRTPADLAQSGATEEHLLGTPAFMFPEQILAQPTDARADLYGLGCVAVWLLSGQPPFQAENALAVMLAHVSRALDVAALLPADVPMELVAILARRLATSPADRPRDARELSAELRAVRVSETQSWSEERARAWWSRLPTRPARRHPAARAASGLEEPAAAELAG